mmetsp:Transcript_68132/g.134481  ORF Transcript_68132/g.134481 Transcript_68132/m.134481 type:complete len:574 (+) Transcript_68132:76-1797(+)|eukprot:CAMPEP_0172667674 /NCGR_PEP_ID=MMETSP1074-20121228/8582_1 /TAXON_ID=2916 /ORGANISM="Ceratium fusus, Strain PA161109" /LENGTH=573 /DNA_ID=CAMNT_0013484223 /DNA_START=65 /DNA_END=1786 /DNA_ORIENTATION=-
MKYLRGKRTAAKSKDNVSVSSEARRLREEKESLQREQREEARRAEEARQEHEQRLQSLEQEARELRAKSEDDACFRLTLPGQLASCCNASGSTGSYMMPSKGRFTLSRNVLISAAACFALQTLILLVACVAYGNAKRSADGAYMLEHNMDKLRTNLGRTRSSMEPMENNIETALQRERYWERKAKHKRSERVSFMNKLYKTRPFNIITGGAQAHVEPEMYGKVPEKTIWAYWYHPRDCRTASNCKLPPVVQLCSETIERNRGGFSFKIVHKDEVVKYVNRIELPMRWEQLIPAHQKDSLMNALLARYGGVAMDISTILIRPLDDLWSDMLAQGATFRGYMYRLNGYPWRHAESTVVWFMMTRREGIFTAAVRNQVIGMGDRKETGHYHHWYLALGDQTVTPLLRMFDFTLPACTTDPTIIKPPPNGAWDQKKSMCPELEIGWNKTRRPEARTDTKLLLRDPRDGPQMPFAFGKNMTLWKIWDDTPFAQDILPSSMAVPGGPMQGNPCASPKQCWEVFMHRYQAPLPQAGKPPLLSFVKLFAHAKELAGVQRHQLMKFTDSFFVSWLHLAGVYA